MCYERAASCNVNQNYNKDSKCWFRYGETTLITGLNSYGIGTDTKVDTHPVDIHNPNSH